MANPFLGQSGNAVSFLGADGQQYMADASQLSPDVMNKFTPVPGAPMPQGAAPLPSPMMATPEQAAAMDQMAPVGAQPAPAPMPGVSMPPPSMPQAAGQEWSGSMGVQKPQAGTSMEGQMGGDLAPGAVVMSQPGQAAVQSAAPAYSQSMKDMNEAYALMGAGAMKNVEAAGQMASAQAKYADEMERQMLKRQQEQDARIKEFQDSMNQEKSKLATLTDEYKNSENVDSGRFFKNQSTAGKIAAALSVGLSAYAQGLMGRGGNPAMDIINQAVDRDINDQKMAIDKKRSDISAQQNLMGQMKAQFQDDAMAEAAAYKMSYDLAENRLKKQLAGVTNTQALAQGQMLLGQIGEKKAMYQQAFEQAAAKNAMNQQVRQAETGAKLQSLEGLDEKTRERAVKIGDGYQLAISNNAAKDLNVRLPAIDGIKEKLGRLIEKSEFSIFPTMNKGELESLKAQLVLDVKNADQLGALDKGAIEIVDKIVGDPTTFWQSNAKARMQSFIDTYEMKRQGLLKQNIPGYKPVSQIVRGQPRE